MRGDTTRTRFMCALIACTVAVMWLPAGADPQTVTARLPTDPITPPWDRGIQPISRDSYWNAVSCGKQGGSNPPCVFWDTDLCRNGDFTLAFYTPYKQVAYEVWQAVRRHEEAPTPSYADAQKTRIILGVKPIPAAKNPIASVVVRRGGRSLQPATQSLENGGGRFIFDFAVFDPTADVTIDLVGRARTVSCRIPQSVLRRLR
jgi:hypothetical protein